MEALSATQFAVDPESQLAPTRHRDDGWTAQRQRAFLERLAECGSVAQAARSVGMSRESAYALRRRADAAAFVQAWDAARALAVEHLTEVAWDRALNGQVRPIYYHGELVGETRHFDNRLLLALIAQNRAMLAEGQADAAIASPQLVARVAADWPAALDRVERGEALSNSAACPAAPLPSAEELELGCYGHWWDEERGEWLTNWPAPADFTGSELAIDEQCQVLGPHDPETELLDEWDEPIPTLYARTLTAAELAGFEQHEARCDTDRASQLDLYRRAAFGLAEAADLARIADANGGRTRFGAGIDAQGEPGDFPCA